MTPRQETIKLLEKNGYRFAREGKNHTIYYSEEKNLTIPVPRHNFGETTQRYILKEAGIQK